MSASTRDGAPADLDRAQVRRAFERAAATYDEAAVLQREVGQRMAERLGFIKIQPVAILDAGCGTGWALGELRARYPEARLIGLDLALNMAVAARVEKGDKLPPQWAGLKFFNVFGPNEYHKGTMMSVLARRFDDIKSGRVVQLFKSHRDGISDGDQRRDFIYVDDVVRVVMWLLATPSVGGLFNVGTGKARSFKDLMLSAYAALGTGANIQYIDMPEQIRGSYQYFTESEVDRLHGAGYNGGFTPLEDAVGLYVKGYLDRADRYR